MTNKELLSAFRRYNKKAREVRAKKLGFDGQGDLIFYNEWHDTNKLYEGYTLAIEEALKLI
jgi:hypothetical protein